MNEFRPNSEIPEAHRDEIDQLERQANRIKNRLDALKRSSGAADDSHFANLTNNLMAVFARIELVVRRPGILKEKPDFLQRSADRLRQLDRYLDLLERFPGYLQEESSKPNGAFPDIETEAFSKVMDNPEINVWDYYIEHSADRLESEQAGDGR